MYDTDDTNTNNINEFFMGHYYTDKNDPTNEIDYFIMKTQIKKLTMELPQNINHMINI